MRLTWTTTHCRNGNGVQVPSVVQLILFSSCHHGHLARTAYIKYRCTRQCVNPSCTDKSSAAVTTLFDRARWLLAHVASHRTASHCIASNHAALPMLAQTTWANIGSLVSYTEWSTAFEGLGQLHLHEVLMTRRESPNTWPESAADVWYSNPMGSCCDTACQLCKLCSASSFRVLDAAQDLLPESAKDVVRCCAVADGIRTSSNMTAMTRARAVEVAGQRSANDAYELRRACRDFLPFCTGSGSALDE